MGMYIGIDIGGTKCSVVYGNNRAEILEKRRFKTTSFKETTDWILESVSSFMDNDVESIGISCGGPLDSRRGLIISPPNLPDWNNYPITEILGDRYGVPVFLQNDADACAVAEWRFGAGIAQYGMGSARILGRLAREGDENAIALFKKIGEDFGKEIAILIDILNPQLIVVGSIYRHCAEFMEDSMWNKIEDEAIKRNVQSVKVVKAQLGEQLGDVAALCVAMHDYL